MTSILQATISVRTQDNIQFDKCKLNVTILEMVNGKLGEFRDII